VPLLYVLVKRGSRLRKLGLAVAAFALSWLLPITALLLVVVPSMYAYEPLIRAILSNPEPSPFLELLRSVTMAVLSRWYFVGQIAVLVVAALLSFPLSVRLARRLLPEAPITGQ